MKPAIPLLSILTLAACKKEEPSRTADYRASCIECHVSYRDGSGGFQRIYNEGEFSKSLTLDADVTARILVVDVPNTDPQRFDTVSASIAINGRVVRANTVEAMAGVIDLSE